MYLSSTNSCDAVRNLLAPKKGKKKAKKIQVRKPAARAIVNAAADQAIADSAAQEAKALKKAAKAIKEEIQGDFRDLINTGSFKRSLWDRMSTLDLEGAPSKATIMTMAHASGLPCEGLSILEDLLDAVERSYSKGSAKPLVKSLNAIIDGLSTSDLIPIIRWIGENQASISEHAAAFSAVSGFSF